MARECAFSSACQVPQRCSRSRLPLLSRSTVKGHATKQSVLPSGLFRDGLKTEIHDGIYGEWSVDDTDIAEVLGYRAGIILCALCSAAVFGAAGVTDEPLLPTLALNSLSLVGTASFATSLVLIHIYVTEIKRTIQALFVFGALGEIWLMATHDQATVSFVADHPWATLLVGPAFAAITGVAVKEGLCYGKLEAAALALLTPVWLLGHLSHVLPPAADHVFAGLFVVIFSVFAGQKLTQNIKDDIGDKSVFTFRKLPESEQEELVLQLQQEGRLNI